MILKTITLANGDTLETATFAQVIAKAINAASTDMASVCQLTGIEPYTLARFVAGKQLPTNAQATELLNACGATFTIVERSLPEPTQAVVTDYSELMKEASAKVQESPKVKKLIEAAKAKAPKKTK